MTILNLWNQESLKPEYLKALPEALKLFSDFLGQRKWFAGDKVTYLVDNIYF